MAAECVCCSETDDLAQKLNEGEADSNYITEHERFEPVCLMFGCCKLAFFSYRQHYGTHDIQCEPERELSTLYNIALTPPIGMTILLSHRQYRFIAYRQLTSWCWGWLGR